MEQTALTRKAQPEPASLTVSEQLAQMTLQRPMNSTLSSCENKAVEELRLTHTPSQIASKFPTGLQAVIMGACPTVDCCANVESPMLGVLSKAYPAMVDDLGMTVPSTCTIWMRAQFTEVSTFTNVKEKMTDWQLDNLCLQILSEFPTLTMMEFILFCARLRSGVYGGFYGTVDPVAIMKSFHSFIDDRRRDYDRKYERERKAKEEREAAESKKNVITWQEYCRLNGIKGRASVLDGKMGVVRHVPKAKEESKEDILRVAKSLLKEKAKNIREEFARIFKKKYGVTPTDYIKQNEK